MIYIRNPTYLPVEGRTQRAAFVFRPRRCGALSIQLGLGFQQLVDQLLRAEAGRETAVARRA